MIQLDPDFRDLLNCFNSASVRYLLIGGYAVNFHGHHRNTKDLDLWIAISPENADAVSRALQSFGFAITSVPSGLFMEARKVYSFGRAPMRVDILTTPAGVDFNECHERRAEAVFDGIRVPVISLKDLLTNKRASGRPRDIDDVAQLGSIADHPAPQGPILNSRGSAGDKPAEP